MIKVGTLIKKLEKAFPAISGFKDMSEWNGGYDKNEAVHLGDAAEGGEIDGLPACDYYSFDLDPQENIYVMGVHRKLRDFLKKHGFTLGCYCPGTYYAYREYGGSYYE